MITPHEKHCISKKSLTSFLSFRSHNYKGTQGFMNIKTQTCPLANDHSCSLSGMIRTRQTAGISMCYWCITMR